MDLIDGLNISGLAAQSIDLLEGLFGIEGDIYLPDSYSVRGDITFKSQPFITRKFLFTNYVQMVNPSPKGRGNSLRVENLEAVIPYSDINANVPERSLLVLKTKHGIEYYELYKPEMSAGNAEMYYLTWRFIPVSKVIDREDERVDISLKEELESNLQYMDLPKNKVDTKVVPSKDDVLDESDGGFFLDQEYRDE